jgi:hypothetical protein
MKGYILQDYSAQGGYTTWLAFPETARTQHKMSCIEVITTFKERFGRAPNVLLKLPGHWRAGPINEKESKQ